MKRETILNIRYGLNTYSYTLEDYLSEGKNTVTIGRSADCDIMIRNARVADTHATFSLEDGNWIYRDTGSGVGSSMNGAKIEWVKVFNGSTIALAAFPDPDTLCIDITVKTDGIPVVPGQPKVSGLQGGAMPGGYTNGSGAGAMQYGGQPGAAQAGAYNQGAAGAFNGAAGAAYNGRPVGPGVAGAAYNGRPGAAGAAYNGRLVGPGGAAFNGGQGGPGNPSNRIESSLTGLNAFGFGAAAVWSIIAVVFLVNFFKTISAFGGANIFRDFSIGLITVALFIMYLMTAGGMVLFPISLFSYRKRNIYLGIQMIAGGFTGIVISYYLILMIGLGSLFSYLLQDSYFLLMTMVLILNLASLISLAGLFKKNTNMEKVNSNWYRPIILFALSWVMVFIIIAKASNELSGVYGSGFSLTDSLPMSNIWMDIAWFAAIILSCVYIHVDENPVLAQKYEVKSH